MADANSVQAPKPSGKRARSIFLKIILASCAGVLVLCAVASFSYVKLKINAMNQKITAQEYTMPAETESPPPASMPEPKQDDLEKIQNIQLPELTPDATVALGPKTVNILLLGLDTRDPKQFGGGRTDSIIIVTLDAVNREIKLTSIMRDTLISIPGHGMNRINTVFGFCGPDVAAQTVTQYFGVKIDYYAVVNFWAVADIIDSLGGVTIDVKPAEVGDLNNNLDEINKYSINGESPHVKSSGLQVLDGKQAVGYMRIRHIGAADFERTQRQRSVLEAIAGEDLSLPSILKIIKDLPNNLRTNIGMSEMVSLAETAYALRSAPVKQFRIPMDGSYKFNRYLGMSVLIVDFEKNAGGLEKFLKQR
jgi:polyisoprenyl-teichoic acid--peptidoglycan teichoic acid transferase